MAIARVAVLTSILLIITPFSVGSGIVPHPCPDVPLPQAACDAVPIILGDLVVGNGETERIDNGTYIATGHIEVQSGGRVEIVNATLVLSGSSASIHVSLGGILIIEDESHVAGTPPVSLIRTDPGSIVRLNDSIVERVTMHLASNDTIVQRMAFSDSPLAVFMDHVNFTLKNSAFAQNTVAINVTGGSPLIFGNEFSDDSIDIQTFRSDPTIKLNNIYRSNIGIHMRESSGLVTVNSMQDRADPITNGTFIERPIGALLVTDNHFEDWGTAINIVDDPLFRVVTSGNTFDGNGIDIQR